MALIENQRYVGERVDLDGNDYLRCTFKECELVYSGSGSVGLDDCVFASCEWSLDGAASATMRFLRGVYHGVGDYGQQMVASLFAEIRRPPTV